MEPIQIVVVVVALLVGCAAGVAVGRSSGRRAGLEEGRATGLREGRDEGVREGTEKARAQGYEKGLTEGRRGEREAALVEAIGKVSGFLHAKVRAPLAGVTEESDEAELRERIGRALGSLEDLDFFIRETTEAREGSDLTKLAQSVAREFAGDHDVGVRVMLGQATIRAEVNPAGLMDALYLILHNASRFGDGGTIDLTVEQLDRRAKIVVRDRGPGFSEEAFKRAFDPFYSTSDEGLGLGLPHARKIIEEMGGSIELRNMPDGGAEVEVSLPVSG